MGKDSFNEYNEKHEEHKTLRKFRNSKLKVIGYETIEVVGKVRK